MLNIIADQHPIAATVNSLLDPALSVQNSDLLQSAEHQIKPVSQYQPINEVYFQLED